MTTERADVSWPTPHYDTAADAVAAAIEASEVGDTVTVHQAGCPIGRDEECSCWPFVVTVSEQTDA